MRIKFVEGDEEDMPYVTSLKDLSTMLVDAFMESEGQDKAVVFVDGSLDVAPVFEVSHDKDRHCIMVRVGYCDTDIDNTGIRRQIKEVNEA